MVVKVNNFIIHSAAVINDYLKTWQASDVFTEGDTDLKVPEVKSWLKSRGVRDFGPVLVCRSACKGRYRSSAFSIHFTESDSIGQ